MDRPAASGAISDSTIKTILLHVQNDATLDRRIEAALSLAKASSAHLTCLHVVPSQAYAASEYIGGILVMADLMKALEEDEAQIRKDVEVKLQGEDVSWEYKQVTGDVASQIISSAALADLVVVGREPHKSGFSGSNISLFGDLIQSSRTPFMIPADDGAPFDPTGIALIAWDGSYEAANAVRMSVGLLKLARAVRLVNVEEQKDERFPSTRGARIFVPASNPCRTHCRTSACKTRRPGNDRHQLALARASHRRCLFGHGWLQPQSHCRVCLWRCDANNARPCQRTTHHRALNQNCP